MKDKIKFPIIKTDDIIAKSGNAGKLGVRMDNNLRVKMPNIVGQGDFPKSFSLKSKTKQKKGTGSLLSRSKYEQTKFKEQQIVVRV